MNAAPRIQCNTHRRRSLLGRRPNELALYGSSMIPMSRFFRRLSLRKSRAPPVPGTVASPNSCPNLFDFSGRNEQSSSSLPEAMIFKCLDYIDNPFELGRFRRVSRAFRNYVDQRLASVVEMDAKHVAFDRLSISSCASDCSHASSSTAASNSSFLLNQQVWYLHPSGLKILMRLKHNRVELLVDSCWTSREVIMLCGAMSVFRFNLRNITLDAPIIEMIIASLSLIDLERWYAFQCYLQAINDSQVHLRFSQPPVPSPGDKTDKPSFYWPNAEVLIIRTTKDSSSHLSRLLDYGVRSQLVMNRRKLDELRIVLTDVEDVDKMNRSLNRNLYHFRCWAGSAGFDERFCQQYSVNVV